jgi:hypothetical protein
MEMADIRKMLNSMSASQSAASTTSNSATDDGLQGDMDDLPLAKRSFASVVGGNNGGLAPAAGRDYRSTSRPPPRSGQASSSSNGASSGSDGGGQQPLRIWVGSFGRTLLLAQLKSHADGLLAKVPAGLRGRTTLLAFNGNNSYKFAFSTLEDLTEIEGFMEGNKLVEWTDARSGEVRFIRVKRDRTVEGRKQGKIMSVLYGLVKQHLAESGKLEGAKLDTAGRIQDTFYVATAEDMWELFKVVRSDATGSDGVVATPFPLSLTFWGIDAATSAKFIEATIAEARRV